jgi:hypothetical protein
MPPLFPYFFIFAGIIMIPALLFQLWFFTSEQVHTANARTTANSPFNNPPGVDIWCGKSYRQTVRYDIKSEARS